MLIQKLSSFILSVYFLPIYSMVWSPCSNMCKHIGLQYKYTHTYIHKLKNVNRFMCVCVCVCACMWVCVWYTCRWASTLPVFRDGQGARTHITSIRAQTHTHTQLQYAHKHTHKSNLRAHTSTHPYAHNYMNLIL